MEKTGSDTMKWDDVFDVMVPLFVVELFIIMNIACILLLLEMVGVI